MDSKPHPLHIFFFPKLAHGELIPIIDMARLFARQAGVKATIVTTQLNASFFSQTIESERKLGVDIDIHMIKFPFMEAGLPEGCENFSSTTSQEMGLKFIKAVVSLLQQPLEQILEDCRPNCLVADAVFPWATEVARKLGIPRLVFHGTSYFTLSVFDSLLRYEPQKNVTSDYEPFEVPGIPDKIEMTRLQQPDELRERVDDEIKKLMYQALESEITSYGVIMNSFQELEPAYVEHYRKVMGRKTWCIGPLSLCNRNTEDKSQRGNTASIDPVECFSWLDSKKHNSVLYICFGSLSCFSAAQLYEIAKGLEASGQDFIWVVEKKMNKEDKEKWLPEGFEERMEGKGLIIRGWAPQVLILDHEAVGGFMTHCGWNSTMESITAGVPMVTWPLSNEQFYNEKLVTLILKVGIGVGAQEWSDWMVEKKLLVTKENIAKAVTQLMVGEEANDIRNRASALKEMAKRAVEEAGSSHSDLKDLLDGLRLNSSPREL
ncbi:scopoletin glucosyltransferase-like [Durio zibethinus]|uniref:Glycosyltransferase n=1 Tax=Durio zibethinus TaxID=66656 RepID=A0A6P6ABS9_DURZI|nr:scopoletin glucosyltransferase-like [Durio zibethinus]